MSKPLNGLTNKEVIKSRNEHGENLLPQKKEGSIIALLLSQFESPLIYLLLGVSIVSFLFGEQQDGFLILAVLVINISIGFYQEFRAQKTLDALKQLLEPITTVIREGKRKRIPTREVVVGDLIVLGAGDVVPADGMVIESVNLLIKEAVLTGEGEAVAKAPEFDDQAYMGTTILSGNGIMEAKVVGVDTKFGQIGKELIAIEQRETPLQASLEKFSKVLSILVIIVALVIFLVGIYYENEALTMLRYAIVLAVAVIPEGLPVVVTVILALGMRRILKQKGLVKNLISVETLGATTVICTDKTGTLTTGNMQVVMEQLEDKQRTYQAFIVNNEQRTNIEIALWDYVHKNGFNAKKFFEDFEKIYLEPFSSASKYALTVCSCAKSKIGYLTGAPEILLDYCKLSEGEKKEIEAEINKLAAQGYRLLAAAYQENIDEAKPKLKNSYTWAGLIGITDPLREDAAANLQKAEEAGIDVKIITGDYRITAEKIAQNLGLHLNASQIIEGNEIDAMSAYELSKVIGVKKLFARVTPEHKLKIVEALQDNGKVVAMTGDGVNDVLALKKADIGIAMGNAVEVAKEASDLILLNNNFSTIISTVEEGRLVYKNIRKVIAYILSNSFAEMILIFGALLLRLPAPLAVAQILWIHLICDGPPDIALGFDDDKTGLLKQKPHDTRKEFILDKKTRTLIVFISLCIAFLSLMIFNHFYSVVGDYKLAQSVVFAFLSMISLTYILSYKDLEVPILRMKKFFKNKILIWSLVYGYILTFIAIYLPGLNEALDVTPLEPIHWVIIVLGAVVISIGVELIKMIRFK